MTTTYPESKVCETKLGPVEYVVSGEGPPLLVIHGGIGGYDQGVLLSHWANNCQIISPSRPGYLKTPMELGKTAKMQADLMVALLDELQIEKPIVYTCSAGGYVAYTLAIHYPDRVKALITVDAVSGKYVMPSQAGWLAQTLFMSDLGLKIIDKISTMSPKSAITSLLKTEALFNSEEIKQHLADVLADESKTNFVLELSRLLSPYKLRKAGTDLDMQICGELPVHLELEKIICPSLIFHGTHDADVLFYHGVSAVEKIENAKHFWIYTGSHFGFWISKQAEEAQQQARNFIASQL